jgi:heme/copper-type cytochrome/quinol oxidase subunit 2
MRRAPAGTSHPRRAGRLLAVLALPLLMTTGCVKSGISVKATEVHNLFYVILWLAVPVFVFVEGMLLVSLLRFRDRGDGVVPRQDAGSRATLGAFFAGPLAIVVVLLVFGETAVNRVDRADPNPTEQIVVTGFQWAWSAHYLNEDLRLTGRTLKEPLTMALPVGRTSRIELRATDVMHEFYVPELLYMKNAVPGHPNTFTVTPTRTGTYKGQCAQFCGLWHSKMALVLKVLSPADFAAWIQQGKDAAAEAAQCHPAQQALQAGKLALVADQISWNTTCLGAAGNQPIQVSIDNRDRNVAHNFAVYTAPDLKRRLFLSPDVDGPGSLTFTLPALPPGRYYFQCDIHGPAMGGTLVIG